jgi:hypothetical protein
MIMSFSKELGLQKPVVMGCSIGGRIVLDLALKHAKELRALIGLQTGAYVERYYDSAWLDHPEVHGGRACGAVAYGLMSPLSPEAQRWETVWHYMQGGPGIFTGDLHFYQVEGDIRGRIGAIDTSVCPLYLLTGEYDYSASPKDTEAAAAKIKGAKFTVMKSLGHFPMSENPQACLGYLRPVLDDIHERSGRLHRDFRRRRRPGGRDRAAGQGLAGAAAAPDRLDGGPGGSTARHLPACGGDAAGSRATSARSSPIPGRARSPRGRLPRSGRRRSCPRRSRSP